MQGNFGQKSHLQRFYHSIIIGVFLAFLAKKNLMHLNYKESIVAIKVIAYSRKQIRKL